jgi:hypothetical protein
VRCGSDDANHNAVYQLVKLRIGVRQDNAALPLVLCLRAGHMRVVDGVGTQLQLQGMCAKLAALAREAPARRAAGM